MRYCQFIFMMFDGVIVQIMLKSLVCEIKVWHTSPPCFRRLRVFANRYKNDDKYLFSVHILSSITYGRHCINNKSFCMFPKVETSFQCRTLLMVMHFFNITPKLFSLDNLPAYLYKDLTKKM